MLSALINPPENKECSVRILQQVYKMLGKFWLHQTLVAAIKIHFHSDSKNLWPPAEMLPISGWQASKTWTQIIALFSRTNIQS